jgi:hypothetical protein
VGLEGSSTRMRPQWQTAVKASSLLPEESWRGCSVAIVNERNWCGNAGETLFRRSIG